MKRLATALNQRYAKQVLLLFFVFFWPNKQYENIFGFHFFVVFTNIISLVPLIDMIVHVLVRQARICVSTVMSLYMYLALQFDNVEAFTHCGINENSFMNEEVKKDPWDLGQETTTGRWPWVVSLRQTSDMREARNRF